MKDATQDSRGDGNRGSGPWLTLKHADRILRETGPDTRGLWPRTVARLTRLALERATDLYWSRIRPEMTNCPMTMRVLMLEGALDRAGARRAFLIWSRLSDATHPHPYELAPTVGELRRWHDEVTRIVSVLDPPVNNAMGEGST
jgi:hypothetical protein